MEGDRDREIPGGKSLSLANFEGSKSSLVLDEQLKVPVLPSCRHTLILASLFYRRLCHIVHQSCGTLQYWREDKQPQNGPHLPYPIIIIIIIIIIINPLTARVVLVPQMTLQPVFSIFPCSPLPSGTCRTPGLSHLAVAVKKRAELTWRAQRNQSAELAGFRSRSKRIQTADKLSESDLGQAKTYFRRNVRIRSVVGKWQLQAFSTAEREKKNATYLCC